ncbi:hypothetical protein [Arthrobacter sp. NicSoilC5]|nr:hypothetical protein [Arthrobacter sp. NicSoilC5]
MARRKRDLGWLYFLMIMFFLFSGVGWLLTNIFHLPWPPPP